MADEVKDDPIREAPQSDEQDLTPPHGDDLRSEETFGRTDRYTNVDDDEAGRRQRGPRTHADNADD
jgi:hypothetical protein